MILARTLAKTTVCVAVLAVGCVNETYGPDEEESHEWHHLNLSARPGGGDSGGDSGGDEGGGEADPGGASIVGVETLDVTIPDSLHAQGLAIPAKLVRPKWSKAVGKRPAMMVLHGSGGLLKDGKSESGPCSDQMESQFSTWSQRLAELGYTVLLPSSYSARGFCDKHTQADKMPKTFDANTEQILGRIYDLDAASRYLCDRPEVDCDRMGLLGFSQGGTMTMIGLHWQIDHALQYFRENKGDTVDIEVPDVAPGRPEFKVGIAYYPGCGFDGAVPLSTSNNAAVENKYLATAPLFILHASDDPLVEHCSTEYGAGSREIQAGQVAAKMNVENLYDIIVYPDAGHSFDSAGAKADGGTPEGNLAAKEAALQVALEQIELALGG
ncbi:Dienelactone hydrolase [Nannocystis exedens]|uniref:Dienelactone hydrolase n=1 Tax=Nannocystis exedens TaxID=54 RepID=A0A1I1YB34_9BACT|nr:dienelactone hydrolase family protein [Nannocystis exedens]PCC71940.1 dienelactone hydrolase [Nannocystis exedens]SFE16817.1 Dienelactone hydrolase [Nannocystis exedens]